ncbi:beta-lactamase-like protein [Xylaria flabelliformis]|nr:beta-lactamase-like protein [Xylaria flabelliformis]
MSTFKGIISEFPEIKVDFFRPTPGFPTPSACFLSHVHSDHLAGLETFNDTFIYCSAATREILLRLEKSSVRLNYARGILEDPRMQTYKHLEKLLKPIPLETPTTIELRSGDTIQVTLLDANHCVGAVMFLFEGSGKAVLYTGDIRCEPRFITATTQNPNIIEYSSGLKTFDRIYLDTSIVDNYPLQTKAKGLRELLRKVKKYPKDTIFHLQAWTYGYEEVWIALSKALNSKVHVDKYKMRVFESLATKSKDNRWAAQTHLAKEAPALVGFTCGNSQRDGCLTCDENVRIHSCEKGMGCSVIENKPVVWIRPIVTHLKNGRDMMEVGIGGGGEDLAQPTTLTHEDISDILKFDTLPEELYSYIHMLKKTLMSGRDISFIENTEGPVEETMPRLIKSLFRKLEAMRNPVQQTDETATITPLPNVIHFPYARHSSLPELLSFVRAFRVKDITPCTFDADLWLRKGWSIGGLFGQFCSGNKFEYDTILEDRAKELAVWQQDEENHSPNTQRTTQSTPRQLSPTTPSTVTETLHVSDRKNSTPIITTHGQEGAKRSGSDSPELGAAKRQKRDYGSFLMSLESDDEPDLRGISQNSAISDRTYTTRREAYDTTSANIDGKSWEALEMISTTNHTYLDRELGGT